VCRCVRQKKSPLLAPNTHKTVKQGPAKENKFNTVLCKLVNQLSGQKNHSLSTSSKVWKLLGFLNISTHLTLCIFSSNLFVEILGKTEIFHSNTSNLITSADLLHKAFHVCTSSKVWKLLGLPNISTHLTLCIFSSNLFVENLGKLKIFHSITSNLIYLCACHGLTISDRKKLCRGVLIYMAMTIVLQAHQGAETLCLDMTSAYQGAETLCTDIIWMWDVLQAGLEPQL
jgi:hypothetical protein